MSVDFEKIAFRRAAKQAEFQRKYDDEKKNPRDVEHHDHVPKDYADHSSLETAFRKSHEQYEQRLMMKPRFEDFKLQFQGPSQQQLSEKDKSSEQLEEDLMTQPKQEIK